MRRNRLQSLKWNSFFMRLLSSFLVVIALLLSFNMFSFTFFKANVREDIVKYNMLGLTKSVENYEKHFSLIEYNLLQLSVNRTIEALADSSDPFDFTLAGQVQGQIKLLTGNPLLYLNNMLIYSPSRTYFVEANGTGSRSDLFITHFAGAPYDADFWKQRLQGEPLYEVHPAVRFYSQNPVSGLSEKGTLFPISVQTGASGRSLLIAFLDAGALFDRFHFSPGNRFLILNRSNWPIFQTDGSAYSANAFTAHEGYVESDDHYLFYRKGEESGFTYVNIVPTSHIAGQVASLNVVLVTVLGIAVAIAFAVSIALSVKFNSPIRRIISVIQQPGSAFAVRSNIRELDWMSEKMIDILREERIIKSDLLRKNDLLKTYGYLDKVKKLYQPHRANDPDDSGGPFLFVLFQLHFTDNYARQPAADQEQASYAMLDWIALRIGERFPDRTTLQVEHNQAVCLLFGDHSPNELLEALHHFNQTVAADNQNCILTIAFHPRHYRPGELAVAYEEARLLLLERRLKAETQIITIRSGGRQEELLITPADDQELAAQLQAGECERALELLGKCMRRLEDKEANADQYIRFAEEIVSKMVKSLLTYQFDMGPFMERHSPYSRLKRIADIGELEHMLSDMISDSCTMIRDKKALQDPVKDFVLDYIANHYHEDLSLESAADQLQMSRSYLSKYFREKTGMTFTDYLNALRMSKAKELLSAKEEVRIGEVATEIGYRNVNSFIRMFKKSCGVTPGEYRRTILQQSENERTSS